MLTLRGVGTGCLTWVDEAAAEERAAEMGLGSAGDDDGSFKSVLHKLLVLLPPPMLLHSSSCRTHTHTNYARDHM